MASSKKPGIARFEHGIKIPPYTEQMKQFYEFATTKRVVRTGGVVQELTHYQFAMHKQLETAIKGNSVAQRDIMRQTELAVMSRDLFIETQCEVWTKIKDRHQQSAGQARTSKGRAPLDLPHPADILIDWTEGVTIVGPMDEVHWKRCDGLAKFRDALFVQQVMEDADNRVAMDDRPSSGAALVHGMLVNSKLPFSFRLSDAEVDARMFFLLRMTKREALARCGEAWQMAGRRLPCGQHYGTLEKLKLMVAAEAALVSALRQCKVDPLAYDVAVDEFSIAIKEFCASAPKRPSKQASALGQEEGHA